MGQGLWQKTKAVFREEMSLAEILDPSQAGTRLTRFLLLVREIYRAVRQDQAFTLATALAYKTLMALVPLLAISLSVVAMLEQGGDGGAAAGATHSDAFLQVIEARMPQFGGKADFIASIRAFADNARLIMGVSFLVFFATAYFLLGTIEKAFHIIWQVKERRSFLSKVGAFIATLLIVPILMSLSVYFTSKIASVVEQMERALPVIELGLDEADADPAGEDTATATAAHAPGTVPERVPEGPATPPAAGGRRRGFLLRLVLAMASILTTIVAMTALYYLLPFTRVRLRAALVGGVLCGLGLEGAKLVVQVFALYVGENYTKIYGPLLAVPFVLLWLWLVWVIVLMGAEVAFVAQNFTDLAARAEMEKRGIQGRIYLAVRVVLAASELFHRGEDPENLIDHVASVLQLPPYMVREIALTLVQCNVLRRITPGQEAFVPAKDISVLTLEEVVHAVENDHLDIPEAPDDALNRYLGDLFGQVTQARRELLGRQTFSQLVEMATSWSETEETVALPYARPGTDEANPDNPTEADEAAEAPAEKE